MPRREQDRVDTEDDGDQAARLEPRQETRGISEQESVADGIARDLPSDQRGDGEGHEQKTELSLSVSILGHCDRVTHRSYH